MKDVYLSMIEERAYHGLTFVIASGDGNRICYILLPEGLHKDGIKLIEASAQKFSCNIVLVTGMDWNADMTPWPSPGVFKKEKPFEGRAKDYLREFMTDSIPGIEGALSLKNPERYLVGISLSGLFALWTLFRTDCFKAIASISGSFWYDNLVNWVGEQTLVNTGAKVHLSLGDKERNSKNPRMAIVEDATGEIAEILTGKGLAVDYQIVPGTHFSPLAPRLELALNAILR